MEFFQKWSRKMMILIVCTFVIAFVISLLYVIFYRDPYHAKLRSADIIEKQVQVGDVNFNYAEGPDNGPVLVLLHAQHLDWYSYSRVLPDLANSFHVYAIDYPGHGKTTYPDDYVMSADNIGHSLAAFIEQVIGEPVYLSGNSSGGLLTTWLAAYDQEYVKAVILEDPPLFSSEADRIEGTIADRSFSTCKKFVTEDANDFLMYWLNSNSTFFENNYGKAILPLLKGAITLTRINPFNDGTEICFLPTDARMMIRGFGMYDARFGAAFHDGSWNKNFDHAKALSNITCPVLLIQANYSIMKDGTLNGAMTAEDAELAMSLLKNGTYLKMDASHVISVDKPKEYIEIEKDFFMSYTTIR